MPRILVLTTGGTIASRLDPETGAVRAVASPDELVELVPGLAGIAQIELRQWASVNSWNMTPQMMFDLASGVRAALDDDEIDGVVITHGTDTVEETGLMTEYLVGSDKPVVYVVAMRNLSEVSPDGPRNLLDAVNVAADPASRGRGPLLVVNETVHSIRYVTKTNTANPATFVSPDYGPAGLIPANGLRYLHPAPERRLLDVPALIEPVHLVKAVSGMDSTILDWLLEQGARGVVLEGSGAGNVPGAMMPGIERALAAGIPVVLSSRATWGFLAATYGSGGASGGGFDLVKAGVIPAAHLPAQKARILLMLALGAGLSLDAMHDLFAMP